MEEYVFTMGIDGKLYKDGIEIDNIQKISKIKYDYNNWVVYCEHCKYPIGIEENEYCPNCGYKLEFNEKENQKFIDEYDKQVIHPYGWPLTKEQIVKGIGKPVYIKRKNGNINWKVIEKIEINEDGYIIIFTDNTKYFYYDIDIYDPLDIIKKELYPNINKEKEKQDFTNIGSFSFKAAKSCHCGE